jgi:type I restriction enzyme, S subunit
VQPSEVSKDTPYIGLEHLPRKSIALSGWTTPDTVTSSKLRFYEGEILFGKIRPYFHKVGVAPVDGICSSDIIVIRPKAPEFAALTAMVTSSDDFVLQAVQTSQGTKMPRANWDVLVKYPVFVPDAPLLNKFNGIAANVISQIRTLTFKNQNLRQTRDLLLPKLISGELDVSRLGADPEAEQAA